MMEIREDTKGNAVAVTLDGREYVLPDDLRRPSMLIQGMKRELKEGQLRFLGPVPEVAAPAPTFEREKPVAEWLRVSRKNSYLFVFIEFLNLTISMNSPFTIFAFVWLTLFASAASALTTAFSPR